MENMTWTETTAKGNTYTYVAYEDPCPGMVGTQTVKEDCGKCGGTGVYQGPSGHSFYTPATGGNNTGCFSCMGRGYFNTKVSSIRARAKRQINARNAQAAADADYAAEAPAREAAKLAADWDEALTEQARRAAKNQRHLGEVGQRLRNLNARVVMVRTFEKYNYVTGAPETGSVVKFEDVSGAVLVWFTGWTNLNEGEFVSLTGTVKKHDARDGEAQTILTRCITK